MKAMPNFGKIDELEFEYMKKSVEKPEFLLEPSMHRGSLSCIYGACKSGKTTAVAILIAKLLMAKDDTKIAYIDTIHGQVWARILIERIEYVTGWKHAEFEDRVIIFDKALRNVTNNFEYIGEVATQCHPDVIFVDCMEDFVDAYNAKACSDFTHYLIRTSVEHDVHICTVMHTDQEHFIAPVWLGKCESKFRTLHVGDMGSIAYCGKNYADRYINYRRVGESGMPKIEEEEEGIPTGFDEKFDEACNVELEEE